MTDITETTELLHCDKLSKNFAECRVLSEVGFTLNRGEIAGIIGPNGAGKTTLMECLAGLLPFDKGEIYWEKQPLSPPQIKEFIFYLPDGILPYAEQRVKTVVNFFQQIFAARNEQREKLTARLELTKVMDKPVYTLSKGYRRRLLLLIGLLSPQPLLLLDEPFDGFDLRQTLGVMELLRESLAGRTLLLSIHQLTEAEKICNRFILLSSGRVAAAGTLSQLQQQTKTASGGLEEVFLAAV